MVRASDEENYRTEETDYTEESSDINFVCGDPQVEPRVGDEYQVEIPPMMSDSEREEFLLNPIAVSSSHSFLVGLPVQVTWIYSKHEDEQLLESHCFDMNESLRSLKSKGMRSCTKIRCQVNDHSKPIIEERERLNLEAVPGKSPCSWKDSEVGSFVLGLYTFGKNFTKVKKFMESRKLGDVMLFYYGKFYKSAKYKSWTDSRKKRNRKCVCGVKLYSGWRQQQLLSRLIPKLSDESLKDRLVDVSKLFAERNTSLESYISALKDLVGLEALVDAVGIGKAKEDLTIDAMEPVRMKQWFVVSSKASKTANAGAYASLTSSDVIKELTCGSRLSKARCNDIFWEAVWPRLLARGWNSEKPKDRGYVASKDYLVFLVPGVRKFSKGKLVKGDHYFDSVSDILAKVASEPKLLEDSSEPSDQENSRCDSQRHKYLQSPGLNCENLRMRFTVVDSSLAAHGKLCSLREFQNLDKESESSALVKTCRETISMDEQKCIEYVDGCNERKHVKNLVEDPIRFKIVDTSRDRGRKSSGLRRWKRLPGKGKLKIEPSDDPLAGCEEFRAGVDVNANAKPFENLNSCKNPMGKDRDRSKRKNERKFVRRAESNHGIVNSIPLLKRRRLSACVRRDISRSGEKQELKPSESDELSLGVRCQDSSREENLKNEVKSETVLLNEHLKSKPDQPEEDHGFGQSPIVKIQDKTQSISNELSCMLNSDKKCSSKELRTAHDVISSEQQEQPNFLRFILDVGKECSSSDVGTSQEQEQPKQILTTPELKQNCSSNDLVTTHNGSELSSSQQKEEQEQQIDANIPRRQSTRSRPLTIRALEAMESGFFTLKR